MMTTTMREIVRGFRFMDGTYDVTVKSVTEDVSKEGKPILRFKAVTSEGRELTWVRSLSESALWSLGRDIVAAGVLSEDSEVSDDIAERTRQFVEFAKEFEGQRFLVALETKVNKKTGRSNQDTTIVPSSSENEVTAL